MEKNKLISTCIMAAAVIIAGAMIPTPLISQEGKGSDLRYLLS